MARKSFALLETAWLQVKTATICVRFNYRRLLERPTSKKGTKKVLLGPALPWQDGPIWQALAGGSSPSLTSLTNWSPQQLLQYKVAHDLLSKQLLS